MIHKSVLLRQTICAQALTQVSLRAIAERERYSGSAALSLGSIGFEKVDRSDCLLLPLVGDRRSHHWSHVTHR